MKYFTGFHIGDLFTVEDEFEDFEEARATFHDRVEDLPPESDEFVLARMDDGEAVIMNSKTMLEWGY